MFLFLQLCCAQYHEFLCLNNQPLQAKIYAPLSYIHTLLCRSYKFISTHILCINKGCPTFYPDLIARYHQESQRLTCRFIKAVSKHNHRKTSGVSVFSALLRETTDVSRSAGQSIEILYFSVESHYNNGLYERFGSICIISWTENTYVWRGWCFTTFWYNQMAVKAVTAVCIRIKRFVTSTTKYINHCTILYAMIFIFTV